MGLTHTPAKASLILPPSSYDGGTWSILFSQFKPLPKMFQAQSNSVNPPLASLLSLYVSVYKGPPSKLTGLRLFPIFSSPEQLKKSDFSVVFCQDVDFSFDRYAAVFFRSMLFCTEKVHFRRFLSLEVAANLLSRFFSSPSFCPVEVLHHSYRSR